MATRPSFVLDARLSATFNAASGRYHIANGQELNPRVHVQFENFDLFHLETFEADDVTKTLINNGETDFEAISFAIYCRFDISSGRVLFLESKCTFNRAKGMLKTLTWFDEDQVQAQWTEDWKRFVTGPFYMAYFNWGNNWRTYNRGVDIDQCRRLAQRLLQSNNSTGTVRGPNFTDFSI